MTELYPEGLKVVARFLEEVETKCEENNVTLNYYPQPHIGGPKGCRGYFCEPDGAVPGELAVAIKRPFDIWFPVLVHEYCHLLQWLDEEPAYKDCAIGEQGDAGTFVDYWFEKQIDLDEQKRKDYFRKVRLMELNNERRAVDIIKIWNLPVDLNEYIRSAAAYVYFYLAAEKFQTWYHAELCMFEDRELLDLMPYDSLDGDFEQLTPEMEKVFYKWLVEVKEDNEQNSEGAIGTSEGDQGAGQDHSPESATQPTTNGSNGEHNISNNPN